MTTISLCMIVRDEETVLARCLDSVQEIADEIIVVDTGSADRTKQIAAAYGRVLDFAWCDDFAAARNFSFAQATQEYILWLDADDVIEPADRARFLQLKAGLDGTADVVMLPYHTAFDTQGRPVFTYYREAPVAPRGRTALAGGRYTSASHRRGRLCTAMPRSATAKRMQGTPADAIWISMSACARRARHLTPAPAFTTRVS